MAARPIVTCPNCGTRNRIGMATSGVPRCSVCHQPLPWVVDAGAETFDREIQASVPVVVDFWAAWCGPCRMVSPMLERIARESAGRLKLVKLDVDAAPEVAARYDVQGIPLLVLISAGQEVDRLVGAPPETHLRQWLEQHLVPAPSVEST
jgi:thioredoxin 2